MIENSWFMQIAEILNDPFWLKNNQVDLKFLGIFIKWKIWSREEDLLQMLFDLSQGPLT